MTQRSLTLYSIPPTADFWNILSYWLSKFKYLGETENELETFLAYLPVAQVGSNQEK